MLLVGCTRTVTVETFHPGYYQQGRYYEGGYQTAYYDIYGNYHPAHEVGPYYEQGRWHRPFVDVTTFEYVATTSALPGCPEGGACSSGCVDGRCRSRNTIPIILDDETVGFIAADGDLNSKWEPTEH